MWSQETFRRLKIALIALPFVLLIAVTIYFNYYVVSIALLTLVLGFVVSSMLRQALTELRQQSDRARHTADELSAQLAEQEQIRKALYESEEQFRNVFDCAASGMVLVDATSRRLLKVNAAFCEMVGYKENELLKKDFQILLHDNDGQLFEAELVDLRKGTARAHRAEKRIRHKNGNILWVMWSASIAHDLNTGSPHFIFQLQDITDRKRAEEQLMHDALHDSLTGLPNRALFMDRLNLAFQRAKRHFDTRFAVLYLDFDRFKLINDTLGHICGDQLLIKVSRRIEEALRASDTIARLGGDEFALLIEDVKNDAEAVDVVARIQQELTNPFDINGHEIFITTSIGIAYWSRDYDDPELLLRDADTALYQAKRNGRARHEIFNPTMRERASRLLQLETDLRRAVERSEFCLHYQPVVDLINFRLRGFEALVRWNHPTYGLIQPGEFIPLAEETNLILQLGEWVLIEACRQLHEWQTRFEKCADLWVSVNVSGKQFMQANFVAQVKSALRATSVAPNCLKLEITESAMMENVDFAVKTLKQIKEFGVKLSVDDFGTGYSSLSYLHRLPLDSLKIDRSFVKNLNEGDENMEIVKTIIMLAQALKLNVVAEGIETFDQIFHLQTLSCGLGQGYYFAKPLDAKTFEGLLGELQGNLPFGNHSVTSIEEYVSQRAA